MNHCLNPLCREPQNPNDADVCLNCGHSLLLGQRYQAIKPLGQGGFGRTFLAVDVQLPLKPRCVIKQFFPQPGSGSQDKALVLFEQEADRLADLGDNANVPQLFEAFSENGQEYLIQEFIDGQNLAQELAEHGTYSEVQIIELLESLLTTLDLIHQKQVIHRDVKPENIIRQRDGKLFLVDLGAAKTATGTALGRTGTVIGSAEYVAPEQGRGKAVFASDLYSLGVTCLHLLTGLSPFDLYDIANGGWAWRNLVQNPVSEGLGAILDQLIAPPTNQRYGSAREALTALETLQNPSPWDQPAKSNDWENTPIHRSNRSTKLLALGLVGLGLLAFGTTFLSFWDSRNIPSAPPNPAAAVPVPPPSPSPKFPAPRFTNPIAPYKTFDVPAFRTMELHTTQDKSHVVTMLNSGIGDVIIGPESPMNLLNLQTGKLSQKQLKRPAEWNIIAGELTHSFANSGKTTIVTGLVYTKNKKTILNELWTINDETGNMSAQKLEVQDSLTMGACSALSNDGSQIISLAERTQGVGGNGFGRKVLVWDKATGKINPNFPDFKLPPRNNNSNYLLANGSDCSLRWSLNSRNSPLVAVQGYIKNYQSISVWNLSTGEIQMLVPRDETSSSFSLSHDGKLLAIATSENVELWDVENHQLLRRVISPDVINPGNSGNPVNVDVKFTSDDKILVVGFTDKSELQSEKAASIWLWEIKPLVSP